MAKIAIMGFGTVGSGVLEVCRRNAASIARRVGEHDVDCRARPLPLAQETLDAQRGVITAAQLRRGVGDDECPSQHVDQQTI